MEQIAGFINNAINNFDNDDKLEEVRQDVKSLCSKFPLYSGLI
jgi:glycine/serine hydroxymethyltransferase